MASEEYRLSIGIDASEAKAGASQVAAATRTIVSSAEKAVEQVEHLNATLGKMGKAARGNRSRDISLELATIAVNAEQAFDMLKQFNTVAGGMAAAVRKLNVETSRNTEVQEKMVEGAKEEIKAREDTVKAIDAQSVAKKKISEMTEEERAVALKAALEARDNAMAIIEAENDKMRAQREAAAAQSEVNAALKVNTNVVLAAADGIDHLGNSATDYIAEIKDFDTQMQHSSKTLEDLNEKREWALDLFKRGMIGQIEYTDAVKQLDKEEKSLLKAEEDRLHVMDRVIAKYDAVGGALKRLAEEQAILTQAHAEGRLSAEKYAHALEEIAEKSKNIQETKTPEPPDNNDGGNMLKQLGGFALRAVGITSVAAAFKEAADQATEFQFSLAKLDVALGSTGKGVQALEDELVDLAKQFKETPAAEAAAALSIVSRGYREAGEAVEILAASNRLAKASFQDVGPAADNLSKIMSAFNVEAEEATDVSETLAVAVRGDAQVLGEMASMASRIGPQLQQAGLSVEDFAGTFAALKEAGIDSRKAMTGLAGLIGSLSDPSEQTAKALARYGIEVDASTLKNEGLRRTLELIHDKIGEGSQEWQEIVGSVGSATAAVTLMRNEGEALTRVEDDMINKTAIMNEQIAANEATFRSLSDDVKKNILTVFTGMGKTITEVLTPAMKFLSENVNLTALAFNAALGGVALQTIPKFVISVAGMVTKVSGLLGGLVTAFGWFLGAIGAFAIGWNIGTIIREKLQEMIPAFDESFDLIIERMMDFNEDVEYLFESSVTFGKAQEALDEAHKKNNETSAERIAYLKGEVDAVKKLVAGEEERGNKLAAINEELLLGEKNLAAAKAGVESLSSAEKAELAKYAEAADQVGTLAKEYKRLEELMEKAKNSDNMPSYLKDIYVKGLTFAMGDLSVQMDKVVRAGDAQANHWKGLVGAVDPLIKAEQDLVEVEKNLASVRGRLGDQRYNELLKVAKAEAAAAAATTDKYKVAVAQLEGEFDSSIAILNSYNEKMARANELYKDAPELLEEYKTKLQATTQAAMELATWQKEGLIGLLAQYDPLIKAEYDRVVALKQLEVALKSSNATAEEQARIYEHVSNTINKTYRDAKLVASGQKTLAKAWEKAWSDAIAAIDSAFINLWENALDGFHDFADTLKNAFKKLLATMLHEAITRPILIQFEMAFKGLFGGGNESFEKESMRIWEDQKKLLEDIEKRQLLSNELLTDIEKNTSPKAAGTTRAGGEAGIVDMLNGDGAYDTGILGTVPTLLEEITVTGQRGGGLLGNMPALATIGKSIGKLVPALGAFTTMIGISARLFMQGFTGAQLTGALGSAGFIGSVGTGAGIGGLTGMAFDMLPGMGRGKNTDIMSMIGGGIGAWFGGVGGAALGGAIGSFVSNALGGGKKVIDRGLEISAEDGDFSVREFKKIKKYKAGFRSKKYYKYKEADEEMVAQLQEVYDGAINRVVEISEALDVNTDLLKQFDLPATKLSFKKLSEEEIQEKITDFMMKAIADNIVNFIEKTEGLSDRFKTTVLSFRKNTEELVAAFEAMAAMESVLKLSPMEMIEQALEDMKKSALDKYKEQQVALMELIDTYDGSIESLQKMSGAVVEFVAMQTALALAYEEVRASAANTLSDLRQQIEESLMTDEQIYAARQSQVEALTVALQSATDPNEILRLVEQISSLSSSAYSLLTEDQQQAMAGDFLTFLDEINAIMQERINTSLAEIEATNEVVDTAVTEALVSAAATQAAAAANFSGSVDRLGRILDGVVRSFNLRSGELSP